MRARQIEIIIQLSPKNDKTRDGGDVKQDNSLFKHHVSKIGTKSLIFNPTVGIVIKSTTKFGQEFQCIIPATAIYQFSGVLSSVYSFLQKSDWYTTDATTGLKVPITLEVNKNTRKFSLFSSVLYLIPSFQQWDEATQVATIIFMKDGNIIGEVSAMEAYAIIETIQHLDLTTFTLLGGLSEQICDINRKVDLILNHMHITDPG